MKLTEFLAGYAAFVSTVAFVWNVLQSRPRLKVDLIFGVETVDGEVRSGVYVSVRNMSSQDVHLSNISILHRYKTIGLRERFAHLVEFRRFPRALGWVHASLSDYSIEDGCPACLGARKSHQVLILGPALEKVVAQGIDRDIMVCVQDQLWNNIYSSVFNWPAPNGE